MNNTNKHDTGTVMMLTPGYGIFTNSRVIYKVNMEAVAGTSNKFLDCYILADGRMERRMYT